MKTHSIEALGMVQTPRRNDQLNLPIEITLYKYVFCNILHPTSINYENVVGYTKSNTHNNIVGTRWVCSIHWRQTRAGRVVTISFTCKKPFMYVIHIG